MIQPFLELFSAQRLNEFIRILVRLQVDDPSGHSRFLQNPDRPKCRVDACTIAVIGEQDFICVTPKQTRLPRCKRSSQ